MKIVATNIAQPRTVVWKDRKYQTGIYKVPIKSVFLRKEGIEGDAVVDKKYHGGVDKACYVYAKNHYPFWKEQYPDLDWNWGMFGENLTIEGIDETQIKIGDVLQIGAVKLEVSQPRIPCYKLGVKFDNQKVVKQFIEQPYSGFYCRVLQEGKISVDDEVLLVYSNCGSISVADAHSLFATNRKNTLLAKMALNEKKLANSYKENVERTILKLNNNK